MAWRKVIPIGMVLVAIGFAGGYFYGEYRTKEAMAAEHLVGDKYKVVRTPGGMLEVSTLRKQETIARKTSWKCPLDLCDGIPKTTTQISAEAHYTYRVALAEYWVLEKVSEEPVRYRLKAPRLEPKLPVAVSLSTIREQSNEKIITPSGPTLQEMQTYLEKELSIRAVDTAYLQAATEAAAKTVEEFAKKWMKDDGQMIDEKAKIEVQF